MDRDYLERRIAEERQRAAQADNDAAREAHEAMAERYVAELERLRSVGATELRLA